MRLGNDVVEEARHAYSRQEMYGEIIERFCD